MLAAGLSLVEIVSAGAFVSACVLLLGVTRVMDLVTRVTPAALVAAIQLAVGLKLAQQVGGNTLMYGTFDTQHTTPASADAACQCCVTQDGRRLTQI